MVHKWMFSNEHRKQLYNKWNENTVKEKDHKNNVRQD